MAEERRMSIENLAQYFCAIEDPRCSGKVGHRLLDILVMRYVRSLPVLKAGATSRCCSKLVWLRTFLELPNGIPSHDTFRRVFHAHRPRRV